MNEVNFKRKIFAFFPDQIIAVKLSANQSERISFTAKLNAPLATNTKSLDVNTLKIAGISGAHEEVNGQVKINTPTRIINIKRVSSADCHQFCGLQNMNR